MEKMFHNEVDRLYKGVRYIVRLSARGHRCGYVEVSEKLFKQLEDKRDLLDCHGGITFYDNVESENNIQLPEGCWVGFDCAHCIDGIDKEAVVKLFGNTEELCEITDKEGLTAVTTEEVERDCHKLIEQLETFEASQENPGKTR